MKKQKQKKIMMNVKDKEMEIIVHRMHCVQILREVLNVTVLMDMMGMVLLVMVIILFFILFCSFFLFYETNLIFTTIYQRCE